MKIIKKLFQYEIFAKKGLWAGWIWDRGLTVKCD
jgi:hypothetical protein